jgi:fimbrial chaperone protein
MRNLIALCFMLLPLCTYAGVDIDSTRVIYHEGKKQASVGISNPDDTAYLIQAWVDEPNVVQGQDNQNIFIIAPPLFRLDPHSQNSVRVIYSGQSLAKDRESLFWLNVKSIPASQRDATNQLAIAFKSRFKLIYRPKGLPGNSAEAFKKITFARKNEQLIMTNPTAYYISFAKLDVGNYEVKTLPTLAPFQSQSITLPNGVTGTITIQVLDDFGVRSSNLSIKN